MKRKIIGVSLLTLATGVYAQSSVTIYGIVDSGLTYQTAQPGGKYFATQSGGSNESRWGLQGTEDLGGGTKANFQLESGINAMNGTVGNSGALSSGLFERHATVGLSNEAYGAFKLGNLGAGFIAQDSWDFDPQQMWAYSIGTLDRSRVWAQAGNGIEYTSPSFGGLTVKGQYALTNSAGNWNGCSGSSCGSQPSNDGNPQGRADGVKLMYNNRNIELVGIYDEIRDQNGQFSSVYAASRETMLGGTYTWGPLKAYIGYQWLRAPQATLANQSVTTGTVTGSLPAGITGAPTTVNHEWAGLSYTASPFVTVTGAIYHANANNGNGNATMYTLAGAYNLSKRTFLYTELAYVTNSATSNIGVGNGSYYGPNTAQGGANTNAPDYGKSQFGAIAGIMHQF